MSHTEKILRGRFTRVLSKPCHIHPFHITLNSKAHLLKSGKSTYILKERYPGNFENECKVLRFLQAKGFRHIPLFYGAFKVQGKLMMVQEFVHGEKLETNKRLFPAHQDEIARILAELHALKTLKPMPAYALVDREVSVVKRIVADTLDVFSVQRSRVAHDFFVKGREWFSAAQELCRQARPRMRYLVRPSLVNREMEFLVSAKGRMYLLDWENSEFGDSAYDIGDLTTIYPAMDLESFLAVFKAHSGAGESVEDLRLRADVYRLLVLIRELFFAVLDYNTCEVYRSIPPRVVALVSQMRLAENLQQIQLTYRKLNSLKKP